MKIKTKPEDFIVDEIVKVTPQLRGTYAFYKLTKSGKNTLDVLLEIAKQFRLPLKAFSYGGRKDRHAIATQYITIEKNPKPIPLKTSHYSLEFLGYLERPMGPDLIQENRFEIAVRDLDAREKDLSGEEIAKISTEGFPNYFDDQRFGTYDKHQGFFAEKILKNHFNGALKIYMTHISSEDKKAQIERKKFFFENWGRWSVCQKEERSVFEKIAFGHLIKNPKGYLELLRGIPKHEIQLYFSAYQGFLWNEVLKKLLRASSNKPLHSIEGVVGAYLFYDRLKPEEITTWGHLTIPLAASRIECDDEKIKTLINDVLKENQLKPSQFNLTKIRQAYFKSTQRPAICWPKNLTFSFSDDETYPRKHKLLLKFSLARGSYATMLIKRLFSELS